MALTNTRVKQIEPRDKDYKEFDGNGLYLHIKTNGSKYWRLKYRFNGKEKLLSIGVYPRVSLAKARKAANKARDQIEEGIDPSLEKKKSKQDALIKQENSFEVIAKEWWGKQKGRWSEKHADKVLRSLEINIFPDIGYRPVADIQPPEIIQTLRKIENRGAIEQASRLLQRTTAVFKYAVQTGRATINPASELSGVLATRKVEHRPSLNRSELPGLLMKLEAYDGRLLTKLAMKLLIVTFVRPGELRGARWEEFDLTAKEWRIPGDRMKMKEEHIVPLSKQTIKILKELEPLSGQYELVFPGERSWKKEMSENTLIYALYRMGYKGRATAHGFRATASSILNESGFNPDAIERQLAHMERNKVRGAYTHHAQYLADRKKIMQWWADYLDNTQQEKVVVGSFGN